jgi:Ion transport protein
VVLALSTYPKDVDRESRIDILNLIFFGFFLIELLIKLIGRGFKFYFRDRYNWFDFIVVTLSAIDITLEYTLKSKYDFIYLILSIDSERGSGAITALRVFRLIKIFKLAQFWKDL